ncbi:hypothetical protein FSP39_011737 [Pinctada imbricata]|uniref:Uncharacterized protein n=1 Tax=Pinctada imbricata TaxID=66713 RepID=A0AA89BYY5_PINIB|nr:hypothetical protein FSP39_011737 [Pinctada imbricata]
MPEKYQSRFRRQILRGIYLSIDTVWPSEKLISSEILEYCPGIESQDLSHTAWGKGDRNDTTQCDHPDKRDQHICNRTTTIVALARGKHLTNPNAGLCSDGKHSQSEALLLDACSTPPPVKWRKGPNVIQNCKSIPPFTPVGMFSFGRYSMDVTSFSGIFVECTTQGFKDKEKRGFYFVTKLTFNRFQKDNVSHWNPDDTDAKIDDCKALYEKPKHGMFVMSGKNHEDADVTNRHFLIEDNFGHGSSQHGYNYGHSSNTDQSKDISHNGGDTDNSRKCDHPDKRDPIMQVYEWTVMHEKTINAPVLGKRGISDSPYFEAYSHFRPDLRHIELLIRNEINSACRQELIHQIEQFFKISTTTVKTHHHIQHTTHKTTAAPARRTTHAHPQTTTPRPTQPTPETTQETTPKTTTTTTPKTTTTERTTTTVGTTRRLVTTKVTTPQTTPVMTESTTTMPILETTTNQYKECSALSIVTALANGDSVQSPRAGLCTDGSHSQSEALLINSCNTKDPKEWKQGPNMAVQLCGQGPRVFELKTTSSVARENAANYYIIDW